MIEYEIKILPRYIKRCESLAPFQQELIEAVLNDKHRLIIVDAPVGSGKTFTLKYFLINNLMDRIPLILLYPTKILMESQVKSLKNEIGRYNVKIWPYDDFEPGKINLCLYSTDSLVYYTREKGLDFLRENRSELLYRLFTDIQWFSRKGGIVTSPDVFYLMIRGAYKNAEEILNAIQNSIIFFDEFHCYAGLKGFYILIEELLQTVANKIILLSATPIIKDEFHSISNRFGGIKYISFEHSKGNENDVCFNYSLDTQICSFNISDINLTVDRLQNLIPLMELPGAIIFDSIFRLRHVERKIRKIADQYNIILREWSGMKKDENFNLDSKTLVLGTSSIEVGVDMKFKTLVFETSYWPSAIQRLGRVGRKEDGKVVILTRKDFGPYIKDIKEIEREQFESILKEVLNDPKEEVGDENSFRGESFKFILYDLDLKEPFIYNENLFAMYEIVDFIDDWQEKNDEEKMELLKSFNISYKKVEELLIYDKIFPIWGILEGKIKNEYDFLSKTDIIFPKADRNELHVKGYVFYGR